MSAVPDAWEDEWSVVADKSQDPTEEQDQTQKKASTKVTKAQKRAQQAEFNRQFWAEAEGPAQPNYFLESRNVVPLRQDFKPAPILLSRKGPILQQRPKSNNTLQPPTNSLNNLSIASGQQQRVESSDEDEEETEESRKKAYEQRQAQAARDREEKQRKYEERRLELFGPPAVGGGNTTPATTNTNTINNTNTVSVTGDVPAVAGLRTHTRSGNSSPGSNTPPHSRSSTPSNRGRKGRNGRGGGQAPPSHQTQGQTKFQHQQHQPQYQLQQHQQQLRELYDPGYSVRPESLLQRQHNNSSTQLQVADIQPSRAPRGPDGTGRGGFGFASRGGRTTGNTDTVQP